MGLLLLTSSLQFAGRALSYALLTAMGNGLAWKFYVGDMSLYLIIKLLRNDILYWIPFQLPKSGQIAVSVLERIGVKTVTDFTGNVIFRHPFEMGGGLWCINMIWGQICVFAIAYLFTNEPRVEGGFITNSVLWTVIVSLAILYIIAFSLLLCKCSPGFSKTWYDTRTGKTLNNDLFLESDDPEVKTGVFADNEAYWYPIRSQIKVYVLENFGKWENEKPSFWKDNLIKRIPLDMIPDGYRKKVEKRLQKQKHSHTNDDGGGSGGTALGSKQTKASIFSSMVGLGDESDEDDDSYDDSYDSGSDGAWDDNWKAGVTT
jgi:hypothetical protein